MNLLIKDQAQPEPEDDVFCSLKRNQNGDVQFWVESSKLKKRRI